MSYMIFVFLCLTSFSKIISRWAFLTFVAEEDLANHMEFEQGLEKMTMHCTTLAKIVGCRSQIQVSEILKLLLPLPTLSTNRVLSCKCEVKVLVSQSCLTVCDPMDCSSPGSSVHGILQARMGSHSFLQGIFPIQGLNPSLLCLLHCKQLLYRWTTRAVLWLPYTCIFLLLILPFLNLLICLCVSHSVVSDPLWPYGL